MSGSSKNQANNTVILMMSNFNDLVILMTVLTLSRLLEHSCPAIGRNIIDGTIDVPRKQPNFAFFRLFATAGCFWRQNGLRDMRNRCVVQQFHSKFD